MLRSPQMVGGLLWQRGITACVFGKAVQEDTLPLSEVTLVQCIE